MSDAKRGPGRPRKYPPPEQVPRNGISDQAQGSHSAIEFRYNDHETIKNIYNTIRSLGATMLYYIFTGDKVVIKCEGKYSDNHARIELDAKKVHHYFFRGEDVDDNKSVTVGIAYSCVDWMRKPVCKTYKNITIVYSSEKPVTHLEFVVESLDGTREFKKALAEYDCKSAGDALFAPESAFGLCFSLPAHKFKEFVSNIKNSHAAQITFSKESKDTPFYIEYFTQDRSAFNRTRCPDQFTITHLNSDDRPLHVAIAAKYLTCLNSSFPKGAIFQIYLREDTSIIIKIKLDNGTVDLIITIPVIDVREQSKD